MTMSMLPTIAGTSDSRQPRLRASVTLRLAKQLDRARTRSGRTGQAFTWDGPVNIRNARFAEDRAPLDPASPTAAWSKAYDNADVLLAGSGGSIPIVSALAAALPDAEALLVGTTDGYANIHGPNERVLLDELERATAAEADFLGRYAEAFR